LTSKVSTFPYDDEKMQKMINFVQNAKGTHYVTREIRLTDLQLRGEGWFGIPYRCG
jgi:hypothetical protein